MADVSYSGRPRNVSLQEQRLAQAQKQLERIEKMRQQMEKQVELEMQRLQEMKDVPKDFTQSSTTEPQLSNSSPTSFQSMFYQFDQTKSNERLIKASSTNKGIDFTGKLEPPKDDESYYRTSDRDQHWDRLTTNPGTQVYVEGYYYSSGAGTKKYEYVLGSTQLPIAVGDMVQAPVHSSGHGDGQFLQGHDRRFIVTDIYTKEKFHPYHDVIW